MVAGRTTVFDNDFYLETTSPANIPVDAPAAFRLSVIMMHIFIQVPRLLCLLRHAISHPDDKDTFESVLCLAESLWLLDPIDTAEQVFQLTTTVIPNPPGPEIADIVPDSFHFHSVDSAILVTRYWFLEISLCGIFERLLLHFPERTKYSLLPSVATVQRKDINAALKLARCAPYSLYTCPSLPILPLRLHTTIQMSIGSWRRLYLRAKRAQIALQSRLGPQEDVGLATQLERALRMEKWVIKEGNRIHTDWKIEPVAPTYLHAAAESVAGGAIPEWLPTSVKFEEEEGDMVMKVEYGIPGERFKLLLGEDEERVPYTRTSTTVSPFGKKRSSASEGFCRGEPRQDDV
jgi:hypothetical protein